MARVNGTMHFIGMSKLCFTVSLFYFSLCYSSAVYSAAEMPTEMAVGLDDSVELTVLRYAADGDKLLVWLVSSAGMQESYQRIARQTAEKGIEVWLVDLLEAHFLPLANSSLYQIPANDISILTEKARQSKRKVYWYTEGEAVITLIRGLRDWQLDHSSDAPIAGVIVNSPNVFQETPDPGEVGIVMPIAQQTNLPIVILQPQFSPRYWLLEQTVTALEQGGSDVFVWLLRDVRGRFHFRPDATEREQQAAQALSVIIKDSTNLLEAVSSKPRKADTRDITEPQVRVGKKERELLPYKGDPQPPALALASLNGPVYSLDQLKGKVVLINFWTTWCPPCVYEMPSLQLLSEQFSPEQFLVLGVNMAESVETINQFLTHKVAVDFPILLDHDGAALKRWQVYAFPTTYVVDKSGKIRLALFGSIEWDTPEIIEKIKSLISE